MTESTPPTLYKCAKCGIESAVKEAFVAKGGGSGATAKMLCFECALKRQTKDLATNYLLLFVMGVIFYVAFPDSWLQLLYFQLLAGLLLMIPLIFLHEGAHALATHFLGLRVFAVHIGVGNVIFSARFLGFRWHIHQYPISGATVIAGPKMQRYHLRKFLITLAGPALHALLIVLVVFIQQTTHNRSFWPDQLLTITLWSNTLLLLGNLYPRKVVSAVGTAESDGWAMYKILAHKGQETEDGFATYYVFEAVDAVDRGDFATAKMWVDQALALYAENPLVINSLGYVYSFLNEPQKARVAFVKTLESSETKSPLLKYMAMNNIAYANILLEDPALLEQADDYSAQAYQNIPWEPSIIGTRGAVLVWRGECEQGIALLKTAMAKSADKRGKAVDACFIALGETRRGNQAEAAKYLAAARQLDPQCLMLDRVQNELSGSGTPALGAV